MKPRLPRAPLTATDFTITLVWVGRSSPELCAALSPVEDECRDAALMLRAMDWRWIPGIGIRPEAFQMWSEGVPLELIAAGGDLSADWYHDLT